ncbi:MAG TPA: hypothetical protein VL361_09020 [Candidatus Limnocylindrales bacterium]|jgi:hypothetical protein|nr:hypothetical protein [Candidatus Limnocylindrales bacterium]
MRLHFDPHKVLLGLALLMLLKTLAKPGSGAQSVSAAAVENVTDERQACETNLKLIFDAIQQYRSKRHGSLPAKLWDLVPEFIDDPKTLVCPIERRTWTLRSWKPILDPAFDPHTSYTYEFNTTELPDNQWRGLPKKTWRDFKHAQMAQLERIGQPGGLVPIVRCHKHEVNLGYNGRVYPGGLFWEKMFAKGKELEVLLLPVRLFVDRTKPRNLAPRDFPPQDPRASRRLLDLTPYYNAQLSDDWQGFPGNHLGNIPSGLQEFGGVPFDVRGIIQLGGDEAAIVFTNEIDSIPVHQRFKRLNVLHAATFPPFEQRNVLDAATFPPESQTCLGSYVLHYAAGQTNEIPIVYGQNIADWWFDPKKPFVPKNAHVAWEGFNEAVKAYGKSIRVYQMSWENPLPDVEVISISLVSHMNLSAPFIIAITVDP